ncbi:ribonuclease HII [Martelella endophytica]|uniref:Ribonuclease HII n=1 Tax=Martelella endophytica TaxID=1486262 RepID=A0A0D5LNE0_MAREN|nr:ribonuclease HII [Martelella endophytica]AJY45297.1 ribonuclease HII [Martelella endophytica]
MSLSAPSDSPLLFDLAPQGPDFSMELAARGRGLWPVAGCDEAGRGPLAGPVVAAAVILDPDRIPDGLNDSKKLSAKRRAELFDLIMEHASISVASSGPALIDRINILAASLDAMRRAVMGLCVPPALVLTDGRDRPPNIACRADAVIKGDARSLSIAAASIVAKVTRDRMMAAAGTLYPAYGFDIHSGYGTARHLTAISEAGPCPLHRRSFRPIREL